MKSGFTLRIPSAKIMGEPRSIIQIDFGSGFGRKTMFCGWWDQKGMVYYELLKSMETVNTIRYRQQLFDLVSFSKIGQKEDKTIGTTQSHFFMIIFHYVRFYHKRFATRKYSAENLYLMGLTHQTWLLPIITCLHRWITHLLSSALVRMKMWKNCSMNGLQQ